MEKFSVFLFAFAFIANVLNAELLERRDPECPAKDGWYPVYLAHPSNCTLFYECSNGYKILLSCPPELHFNPTLKVCDFEDRAGCKQKPSKVQKSLRAECPATDPWFPIYMPHETNCNLFYECSNGEKVLLNCPPSLHFNPVKQVCDYPETAGCAVNK